MKLFDVEKMKAELAEQTEKHVRDGKRWLEQTRDELIQELERRAQVVEQVPSTTELLGRAIEVRVVDFTGLENYGQNPLNIFLEARVDGGFAQKQAYVKIPKRDKLRMLVVFLPLE